MSFSKHEGYCIVQTSGANLIIQSLDNIRAGKTSDKNTRLGHRARHPVDIGENSIGKNTGLRFTVKDVFSAYNQLMSRGVEFESEPIQQNWGGYLVYFYDLDNNRFALVG